MKLKATSLFLGLCLAILAAATSPAYARTRSTTAYSAFHVEINTLTNYSGDPYLCLFENNGAVVNTCDYTVDLEFDLPIDTTGAKTITVQDGWSGLGTGSEQFSCQVFAYSGSEGSSIVGTNPSFTGPGTTIEPTVTVPADVKGTPQYSIQLLCNVPAGDAVANLNWNL
jgi:hypothetical protein